MQRSKRFSRSLVQRVRDLTPEEVRDALADDTGPFPYLLSESEIKAFWDRHKRGLRYIDKLIKTHGEEAVLAFP